MRLRFALCALLVVFCLFLADTAEAKRKKRRRRYSGPPPTHPVVLWARTLSASTDREERKIAAFKLSQYSQPIFQPQVVDTVIKCMKDSDVEIKILCAKAMGRAGTQSSTETIRRVLLDHYHADPELRPTIVRVFITRKDASPAVHDTFLDELKKAQNQDEILTLLNYFEQFGFGSGKFADTLVDIYKRHENDKIRRTVAKALGERAQGQDSVVGILASCAETRDTPLALICLSGLQVQGKKDPRAWSAVEKTIESSDPDVLTATLDVINAFPEGANAKISLRLVEILEETEDLDIQEKAVLALGVCGDQSENTVKAILSLLEKEGTDDSVRVAAALVLGKQAVSFPDKTAELLSACATSGKTQSLRTACQLGSKELEQRKKMSAQAVPAVKTSEPPPGGDAKAASRETETKKN